MNDTVSRCNRMNGQKELDATVSLSPSVMHVMYTCLVNSLSEHVMSSISIDSTVITGVQWIVRKEEREGGGDRERNVSCKKTKYASDTCSVSCVRDKQENRDIIASL